MANKAQEDLSAAQQIERKLAQTPGMQVVAEIRQGERAVLEYLVSPIKGVFQEAAREH